MCFASLVEIGGWNACGSEQQALWSRSNTVHRGWLCGPEPCVVAGGAEDQWSESRWGWINTSRITQGVSHFFALALGYRVICLARSHEAWRWWQTRPLMVKGIDLSYICKEFKHPFHQMGEHSFVVVLDPTAVFAIRTHVPPGVP